MQKVKKELRLIIDAKCENGVFGGRIGIAKDLDDNRIPSVKWIKIPEKNSHVRYKNQIASAIKLLLNKIA